MSSVKDLDLLLQSFVDKGIPGCALKVVQNGTTLYEGYFGHSDTSGTPLTDKSVFRLASMSKIPLYTAMMMLYERGAFLLSDPVSTFFPEWATSKKYVRHANGYIDVVPTEHPVTIRDTLTMKCGLPYCNSDAPTADPTLQGMQNCMKPLWEKGHYTLREQIRAMADAPLAFEPGSHWLYGFSSELAAGIIEAVCEKPVNEALRDMIFDPLEMNDTGDIFFGDISDRMVKLYVKKEDGSLGNGPTFFDEKHLSGDEHEAGWRRLFSTADDYSKLMQLLSCGGSCKGRQLIGSQTIDLMRANSLTPQQQIDFEDAYNAGYGYGCGVRTVIAPERGNMNSSIGAFGWTGAFGTWCEADPSEKLSIVYMHNLIPNDELSCHHRVRTAAYGLI